MSLRNTSRLALILLAGGLIACQPTTGAGPTGPSGASGPTPATGTMPAAAAVDAEACDHLTSGPAVPVVGSTVKGTEAPQVNDVHRRFDVTLQAIEGKQVGTVQYTSGKAGNYGLFLNEDVPVTVQDANQAKITPMWSATSSATCGLIKGRHVFPLGVGTYYVTFGPTDKQKLGLVVEPVVE